MSPVHRSVAELSADDVDDLAHGCELLGGGGGGSTLISRMILRRTIEQCGPVPIIDVGAPDAFDPDATVVALGAVGSSTVMRESLPSPHPFVAATALMEQRHGEIGAVLTFQIGGTNGVFAALAASALRLPLVDADSTGRALTVVDSTVLGLRIPLTELAFAGTSGGTAFLAADDGRDIESMLRAILPAAGGWGAMACHRSSYRQIVDAAVAGSVTRALLLGAAVSGPVGGRADALHDAGMTVLFEGNVVALSRRTGLYAAGVATLQHHGSRHRVARVDFANEYVAVFDDGELVSAAPDIVCVLDRSSWRPISTEDLELHQRVRVVSFDAPPELRAAHRTGHGFGLAAHGFVPVWEGR